MDSETGRFTQLEASLPFLPAGWLVIAITLTAQFWAEELTGAHDWDDGWFEAMIVAGVLLGGALLTFARRGIARRRAQTEVGEEHPRDGSPNGRLASLAENHPPQPPETRHAARSAALSGRRTAVVLPALNAAKTLRRTFDEIPHDVVDDVILTDDGSADNTADLARALGIYTVRHESTRGYGSNQKSCYAAALARGADIVVMVHPDYQYSPRLVTAMAAMIASGHYDVVLGSRILGDGALRGGMPLYKYASNRVLTLVQNLLLGKKLSEYHTGYRAWSREVLETLPLLQCSDDFVFDNEMLTQAHYFGFRIGEISCPANYFPEASTISFRRAVVYGFGVLRTSFAYRLHRQGIIRSKLFAPERDARLPNAIAAPEAASR